MFKKFSYCDKWEDVKYLLPTGANLNHTKSVEASLRQFAVTVWYSRPTKTSQFKQDVKTSSKQWESSKLLYLIGYKEVLLG